MDKTKTVVIFRAEKSGSHRGDVTAVFPELVEDDLGLVRCYAHLGQHGAASRQWYYTTRPAKPAEYRELAKELRAIGYHLDIRKRWTRNRKEAIPPCAAAMGCLCAGHARGDSPDLPCNTNEDT